MKKAYLKIFTRIFLIFALFNSTIWCTFFLTKSETLEPVKDIVFFIVLLIHIGVGIAVFNEFSENKQ